MSSKYPGGLITKNPAATVGPSGDFNDGGSAPGIWSVDQAMALQKAGAWPSRIKIKYLWSWGFSDSGQVGDNTILNRSSPVQVGAEIYGWRELSSGVSFTLAIRSDGTLWSWGSNGSGGPLGDNTTADKSSPVQIGTDATWSQVAGGQNTSFAIKTNGTLWSWGTGTGGVLGDSTVISRSSPVQIGTDIYWSKIDSGNGHCLAIKTDGTMWSWGANTTGQLGDNTVTPRSSPVQIAGVNWSVVSGGDTHSAAIKTDGTLWMWGNNGSGPLGQNDIIIKSSPVQVASANAWSKVTTGDSHTVAIKTDGTMWSWGLNSNGQLGDSTILSRSSPVQIASTAYAWSLVATSGQYHTIATKTDGTIWAWGAGTKGQIGNNTVIRRSSPIQIGALDTWSKITSGRDFTAAIKTDTTLWTWGANNSSQLGENDTVYRSSPVQVGNTPAAATSNWSQISFGSQHAMAIKTDGTLWAWGLNNAGRLGNNTEINRSSPVQIGALTSWSQTAAGGDVSIALKTDGTLWSWGDNAQGKVGDNTTTRRSSPVQIASTTIAWSQISNGSSHAMALKTDGTMWLWGVNNYGQIGDNVRINRSSPVQLGALTSWSKIAACETHSMAIKDGTLWGWGDNQYGQIGDSTLTYRSSPVQIASATIAWSEVSGGSHVMALKTDGTLWLWGYNGTGAVGLNSIVTVRASSPTILGALTTWSKISAGVQHSMAIKTDGTLWLWGRNGAGRLGDNTILYKSSPVQVGALVNWSKIAGGKGQGNSLAISAD